MDEKNFLNDQFEANRAHLRAVAYRMLGSLSEAEDAVQETWLRLNRADAASVENLGGWLTTVTARVCLDMLRSRKSRREETLETEETERASASAAGVDPEQEALFAESVGLALLVVLKRLEPAERVAFVLHDTFGLPFEDIAPVVGRSITATRQLASRARRRVRGADVDAETADVARQRQIVGAFLKASRDGDLTTLLAMLDPDVVFRSDAAAVKMGGKPEIRGADAVAQTFKGRAAAARPALLDGVVGIAVAPQGHLRIVLNIAIADGRIVEIEAIADPEYLQEIEMSILDD